MNHSFDFSTLIVLAVACAMACWIFAALILHFIFSPKQPHTVLGLSVQGIVPAKQQAILASVFCKIEQLLLSKKEVLTNNITAAENVEKIMPEIEKHIEDFLTVKLPQDIPMLSMFIGEKTIHQIKEVFMKELRTLFPKVLSSYIEKMFVPGNIQKILEENIHVDIVTTAIAGFEKKCKPRFLKIKLFAIVFGLLFGIICYASLYWFT